MKDDRFYAGLIVGLMSSILITLIFKNKLILIGIFVICLFIFLIGVLLDNDDKKAEQNETGGESK